MPTILKWAMTAKSRKVPIMSIASPNETLR